MVRQSIVCLFYRHSVYFCSNAIGRARFDIANFLSPALGRHDQGSSKAIAAVYRFKGKASLKFVEWVNIWVVIKK
jgi:hypothetical protein